MSIADAQKAGPPKLKRTTCSVGDLLTELFRTEEHADEQALLAMLNDRAWTGAAIAEVLKQNGDEIKAATINRHRYGRCSCADWNKQ